MSRDYQPEELQGPREGHEDRVAAPRNPLRDAECKEFQTLRDPQTASPTDRAQEPRKTYRVCGRTHRLRSSEVATMVDVGKFRGVSLDDLREFSYQGNKDRMRPDVRNLILQNLVQIKSVPHERKGSRKLIALTRTGHRLLKKKRLLPDDQVLYNRFGRSCDAHHDADLYRLYQNAANKIARSGGSNLRVVLDYELKNQVHHDLAKLGSDHSSTEREHAIAAHHELRVVRGRIPIPDVRIEYDTADGERARVDLELVTNHYRPCHVVEKVRAGFAIYARGRDVSNLRRILAQRELTAEILSL